MFTYYKQLICSHIKHINISKLILSIYRGCQITSPPVVSGGFVGQVKPRRGSKNCDFVLGFNLPVVLGEFLGHVKPRGGSNLTPTVNLILYV